MVFNDKDSTHTVTVSRLGFKEQTATLRRDYQGDKVNIELRPLTRRVTINVSPVAANLMIDGRALSAEPTDSAATELEFTVDARNNWTTHQLVAQRAGYERLERVISWQDRDGLAAILRRREPPAATPERAFRLCSGGFS